MKKHLSCLGLILWSLSLFPQKNPPNVVLILADDLGYGDLASYGHREIKTPHLDQLAAEGMKFTHFYSPSPLCSPSRAGILTGRTPFKTGIESWIPQGQDIYLRTTEMSMGKILKAAGYQTFAMGKWHLNGGLEEEKHPRPDEHGFDHWLLNHAFALPTHKDPNNFFENGEAKGVIEGYSAQIVVDEAIRSLENRDSEKPFFLYIPFNEPHTEIASPDAFNEVYAEFTEGEIDLENLKDRGPGEYYANISHLDYQIGRVLSSLDSLGLRENTLLIFTSDNGPVTSQWRYWWETNMYGSTGGLRGRKADLFEGGIRVPCIIRYPPLVKAATVSDIPWQGYDLLPTICSILDIKPKAPTYWDGEDMRAMLEGKAVKRQRALFWAFYTRQFDDPEGYAFALRNGDWKLITDKNMEKSLLYNLADDPYELKELSSQEPERLASMLAQIGEWKKSIQMDLLRQRRKN
ncbi:MAG: sulfatase-like hydrolase/transferase [Bacteroidota bacterium]